jgi:hypothetical protein
MDMADPNAWKWQKRFDYGSGYSMMFLGCHWTDASLPVLGQKGIVLLGALTVSTNTKFLVVIDPLNSSTGTFVQKLFRLIHIDSLQIHATKIDLSLIVRTHLRTSGNQIRLYAMGKESGYIPKFVEFKHEVGTTILTARHVQFLIGSGWSSYTVKNTDFMFTDTSLYIAYSGPVRKTV